MRRLLLLVVLAGAAVWALVFVDFARPRERPTTAAAPPADVVPAELPPPQPRRAPVQPEPALEPAPEIEPAPTLSPAAQPEIANARAALLRGAVQGPGAAAEARAAARPRRLPKGALSVATGELGEGSLSPEYAEMERTYTDEIRDGAWADAQEEQLRKLFEKSSVESEVVLLNCQSTLCRIVLESDDFGVYQRLLQVRGLPELTGLGAATPYSHRSGQLSVYFQRRGGPGSQ